jgi:DNA-binding beta-propeller fold protein YncE
LIDARCLECCRAYIRVTSRSAIYDTASGSRPIVRRRCELWRLVSLLSWCVPSGRCVAVVAPDVFAWTRRQADGASLGTQTIFRGQQSRVIATPGVVSLSNGVAVSRDGSTLLVSDNGGGSHSISVYNVADGVRTKVFGGPAAGSGPLQLNHPCQVWIADDGVVFVADCHNNRVQVLTPGLDACVKSLGGPTGTLNGPAGVCANADIVVVSEIGALGHRLTMFKRSDNSIVRRMGSEGSGDGQLKRPHGVCFVSGGSHVAVADYDNDRVCVFSVDGTFVRHVGVGVLKSPVGVACSAFDELVVADCGGRRVRLFSVSNTLLKTFGDDIFVTGVAIHGGTIFAQDNANKKCVLYV